MISDSEASEIYQKCVSLWGSTAQFMMVIEEISELVTVLCHALRANKPFDLQSIKEEMVDVQIMLEQLQLMLKFSDAELLNERERKLQRLKELIKNEERAKNGCLPSSL